VANKNRFCYIVIYGNNQRDSIEGKKKSFMGFNVFKNISQAHYMLETAEGDTGQLLLVSDMCCGSQLLLVKPLSKSQFLSI